LTAAIWDHRPGACDLGVVEMSDVISFHDYLPFAGSKKIVDDLKHYNRPIFVTEWLCRQNGNQFDSHLPLYRNGISGAYNWGLIKGKTQTNLNGSTLTGAPDEAPAVWQHDLFYADGRPYDTAEIAIIKHINDKMK
jgi:hypothetical protein